MSNQPRIVTDSGHWWQKIFINLKNFFQMNIINTPVIRLFQVPTDVLLSVGMTVAYKGYDGEYAAHRIGVILDKFEDAGTILYNVSGCCYTCDELRFIYND